MGDGQSLFVSDQELLCEWTTGATTRSKNVDSLPLDQIIYMNVLLRCVYICITRNARI